MSDDLKKRIKDRGDWLVDAVATSTQNRKFLRGEPDCDNVACDAIRMNGEKAMTVVAKPLADRIKALEAERDALKANLEAAVDQIQRVKDFRYDPNIGIELNMLEATLKELKGEK